MRCNRDARALLQLPHPEGIIETYGDECCHGGDLKRETGNHDVRRISHVLVILRRGRGQSTTGTLENKADEITRDEDHGVGLGLDA